MEEPWSKFFWSDYESDESLRVCSLAAQGLWMRILCLMARATPKGELRIAGEPCSVQDLAKLVGESDETVAALLDELARRGVYSVTRSGVIYSRRMRKDAELSRKRAENGRKGGCVTAGNKSENGFCSSKNQANVQAKLKPQKPEARARKQASKQEPPELVAGPVDTEPPSSTAAANAAAAKIDFDKILDRCISALPEGVTWRVTTNLDVSPIVAAMRDGADLERDVIPAIKLAAERAKVDGRSISSWKFFAGAIADRVKARTAARSVEPVEPVDRKALEASWRWALVQEAKTGAWPSREIRKAEIPKEFVARVRAEMAA